MHTRHVSLGLTLTNNLICNSYGFLALIYHLLNWAILCLWDWDYRIHKFIQRSMVQLELENVLFRFHLNFILGPRT